MPRKNPRHHRARCKNKFYHTLQVSHGSIHSGWKQRYGGLIRWFLNLPEQRSNIRQAERFLEQLYVSNHCDEQHFANALLELLHTHQTTPKEWISVKMVVKETDGQEAELAVHHDQTGKSIVEVPQSAIGKPYFFRFDNHSCLPLACAMTIDSKSVATNAPIPSNQQGIAIRPDNTYHTSHEWRLEPSNKVSILEQEDELEETYPPPPRRHLYTGDRVSWEDYPDPTCYGWNYVGVDETARIERFQTKIDIGTVRLEFHYAFPAKIHTHLDHPTLARVLIRTTIVPPDMYRQVLQEPKFHTNIGYPGIVNVRLLATPQCDIRPGHDNDKTIIICQTNTRQPLETQEMQLAKNIKYNFDEEGHVNRSKAIDAMKTSFEFQSWQRASLTDCACVHAKFFVSERCHVRDTGNSQSPQNQIEQLPAAASIRNIKATEYASLSTSFCATGETRTHNRRRSRIRMRKLRLNNSTALEPLFEIKLYYRRASTSSLTETSMQVEERDDVEETPLCEKLTSETPLSILGEVKYAKLLQLRQWHKTHKSPNDEVAEFQSVRAQVGIQDAPNIKATDNILKIYWDWYQQQEMNAML